MISKFNIFRACIYGQHSDLLIVVLAHCVAGAVLTWTVICMGIAAHFQSLLVITDLSEFCPLLRDC